MKQLGWSHCVPEKVATPRGHGRDVPFPDVDADYLLALLDDIGPCEDDVMGAIPVSWLTLDAWQRISGIALSAWEAQMIRAGSRAYVGELNRRAKHVPAPYSERQPMPDSALKGIFDAIRKR